MHLFWSEICMYSYLISSWSYEVWVLPCFYIRYLHINVKKHTHTPKNSIRRLIEGNMKLAHSSHGWGSTLMNSAAQNQPRTSPWIPGTFPWINPNCDGWQGRMSSQKTWNESSVPAAGGVPFHDNNDPTLKNLSGWIKEGWQTDWSGCNTGSANRLFWCMRLRKSSLKEKKIIVIIVTFVLQNVCCHRWNVSQDINSISRCLSSKA